MAFALVYGIALWAGWMNPYWAGWSVAVIALPTAGASILKGTYRAIGTIPGCIAALVIHALAPQERVLFMLLTCGWMFFTTYLMLSRKKDSYLWTMAGYTCLVILLADVDSPGNMFQNAVFRTVETIMGVVVYTLIAVFLWPLTNLGAIRKSSADLATTLNDIYCSCRDTFLGQRVPDGSFYGLQAKVVQQLAQFSQVIQAEGSESYEVKEVSHLWERLHELSTALLETAGRWQSGLAEIAHINVQAAFPELQTFLSELDSRFAALSDILANRSLGHITRPVALEFDRTIVERLPSFDRAAVEIARKEMLRMEALTADLMECALDLAGQTASGSKTKPMLTPEKRDRSTWLPVPDSDHLRSAAFVSATTGVGFLIWILFDPPGHSGWFQLSGTFALLIAAVPYARASKMIMPVAVSSAICLAIYVFVMPQLSSFLGLGALLFTTMFLVCYFLTGMTGFFCSMAILNMLVIQNHQVYVFAPLANFYIFLVMVFAFLFVMSYLLGSPRPEKVVLHLLDRFFRSAEFLMSRKAINFGRLSSLELWRIAFHARQLRTLPAKIAAWSKAIDRKRLPEDASEQIQALVISIQSLVYRMEQFLETDPVIREKPLSQDLRDTVKIWHAGIENIFGRWSRNPEAEPVAPLRQRLEEGIIRMEKQTEEVLNRAGDELSLEEGENFFRLLGGYRGISEAVLAYAGIAQDIKWSLLREERFS